MYKRIYERRCLGQNSNKRRLELCTRCHENHSNVTTVYVLRGLNVGAEGELGTVL